VRATHNLLLMIVAVSCSACADGAPDSHKTAAAQSKATQAKAPAKEKTSDCVRGAPEKLLASRSEFKMTSSKEALEIVQTNSAIKLNIRHSGCTHYALAFEFTWPKAMPPPSESLVEAAQILQSLPVQDAYVALVKTLVTAFKTMAKDPYKQPLTLSETDTLTATTPSRTTLRVLYDVAL
jgi:hypothetical protein